MHQIITLALQGVTISYLDEEILEKEAVSFVGQGHWVERVFFFSSDEYSVIQL